MKRTFLLSIICIMIVSLAAPAGAAFALMGGVEEPASLASEDGALELDDTAQLSSELADTSDRAAQEHSVDQPAELLAQEVKEKEAPKKEAIKEDSNTQHIKIQDEGAVVAKVSNSDKPAIVIAGIRTTNNKKYVMLYNQSDADYDADELTVYYHPSSRIDTTNPTHVASFTGTIAKKSYVLIAQQSWVDAEKVAADATFTASILAQTDGGAVQVVEGGEEMALFCWGKSILCGDDVYRALSTDFSYQHCLDEEGWQIACLDLGPYRDFYLQTNTPLLTGGGFVPAPVNECIAIRLSEIAANTAEQFVEVYNPTDTVASLKGCQLQIRNTIYVFGDEMLEAREFYTVVVKNTRLQLSKTTSSTVYLLSSDGKSEVDEAKNNKPSEGTSWALVDGVWRQTYRVTAGAANIYEQYPPCQEGYWRNFETGRCNKIVEPKVLADCVEGKERNPLTGRCRNVEQGSGLKPCRPDQYRSPETNRCRKIGGGSALTPCKPHQYRNPETNRCRSIVSASSSLKPCRPDQFRNPATNRCKKIDSSSGLKPCRADQYRNKETNRCRKILATTPNEADFAVEDIAEPASVFIGWWVLGGIALLAVGYAGWEWREEIKRLIRRVFRPTRSSG